MARHRTAEEKILLGERARAMRAAGKSRREIQSALGIGDDLAKALLRGAPVPANLRRPRAKDELRERARELREAGWTYPQIAQELGVSKSSCSLWLRDMVHPLGTLEGQERRTAAIRASSARTLELREQEREAFKQAVSDSVGPISSRDLLLALAVSYWCEGAKDKPWSRREHLAWMNSNPTLVRLFLEGLALLDVRDDQLRFRLHIHDTADEQAARTWWADVVGRPSQSFQKSVIKTHKPKTNRQNVGAEYRGCLEINVVKSRDLYRVLDGLVRGLADQPRQPADAGGTMARAVAS